MFKIPFLSFLFIIGVNQASAVKMTWDDPDLGTGLHVYHQETNWAARETRKDDIQFYKNLHGNTEVMKTMESGKPLSEQEISTRVEKWVERFSQGLPTGRLILEKEKPIGFVHLCPNGSPGVGELARALLPEVQGQGLGKETLGFIVKEWAPAVRKRGLGLDIDKSHPTVKKFNCFGDEALKRIYATARPANPASWQCYKHFDFHPSKRTDTTHQINCESWEKSQHGSLEEYILKQYFSETSSDRLQINVRYSMVDENGLPRTISFVKEYESLRYHFEKEVQLEAL